MGTNAQTWAMRDGERVPLCVECKHEHQGRLVPTLRQRRLQASATGPKFRVRSTSPLAEMFAEEGPA